jgi:heptosyltransferase-1
VTGQSKLNILIVKLSAIGDVVHCLPVAAALKAALPDSRVTWLVDKGTAELLHDNPCIDEVIAFEGKSWSREFNSPGSWPRIMATMRSFYKELRGKQFDVALEMQGLFKSGLLALLSGAPLRIGFDGTREFAEKFLTHRVNVGDYFGHDVPVVELNLRIAEELLRQLGKHGGAIQPKFSLPPTSDTCSQKVAALITPAFGSDELAPSMMSKDSSPLDLPETVRRKICVLIPGTTWVTKIWPLEYWYQLANRLAEVFGYKLFIVGAKSEIETNKQLCARINSDNPGTAFDLTTRTSLLDLTALFQVADLVVGGDTGPLHLAAAVGLPNVVGIYGSTPWRRNGPYGKKCLSVSVSLDCQPCYSKHCKIRTVDCLQALSVEKVFSAIAKLRESVNVH